MASPPRAGLGVYRGKIWEPIGMKNGAQGFWAGRRGSPEGSGACPCDCPGTDGEDQWTFWGLNSPAVLRFSLKQLLDSYSISP